MNELLEPRIAKRDRGRALYVGKRGEFYVSQRYAVQRSDDGGNTWQLDCYIPPTSWKPWVAWTRLSARLLRYYIAAFEILADGTRIAVARDGIYRAGPNETAMTLVFRYPRGSRPLNIGVDGNRLLFGEYGNLENCEVRIYASEDGGKTFDVCYQFPRGDIRHLHNVFYDPQCDHYWVLAGDFGRQTGIGVLSKDLKNLDWITRGSQLCRVVRAILLPDRLVYGTDCDGERNFIASLDKASGRIEKLLEIEGSSLYATTFGSMHVISTCVEPNPACPSRECSLYMSLNATDWKRTFVQRKDRYHFTYFQFGTIVLPYSQTAEARGLCSGQAIEDGDDTAFFLDWT